MTRTAKRRRELIARGHHLKARETVCAEGISEAVAERVRRHLAEHDLVKVRVRAESGEQCEQAASELAARVRCEIVTRVGRVVLLHRSHEAGPDN